MEKDKRQGDLYFDEEDGTMAVHQLITESYQSGVVDRYSEKETEDNKEKKE